MCLFTEKLEFKIAEEDKTFYKVLVKSRGIMLITPYREEEVELDKFYYPAKKISTKFLFNGILYKIISLFEKDPIISHRPYIIKYSRKAKSFIIGGGIIHLFTNKDRAIVEQLLTPNSIVVKAIIPKGTKYIESYDNSEIGTLGVIYEFM